MLGVGEVHGVFVSCGLPDILGYPFLRFFDPEIFWRDRVMRITKGERVFNVPMDTNIAHYELVHPVYGEPAPNEAHTIISALNEA